MRSSSSSPRLSEGVDRKRRAHAKSRKGCGNCKLRRVKCDETRPECKKCVAYGVSCNYDGKTSLDLCTEGSFQVELTPRPVHPRRESRSPMSRMSQVQSVSPSMSEGSSSVMTFDNLMPLDDHALSLNPPYWTYTDADMATLKRFQERTVTTIGPESGVHVYRDSICPMAFSHPFLMHMILSLTLMHDAHLAATPDISSLCTNASLGHWNTATILFNRTLSEPIAPESRDALWATAALIGANVFAYVEATTVEQAWPLKPSDPSDLNWLKLSDGKKVIWKLADPLRPDSVFSTVAHYHDFSVVPAWIEENDFSSMPTDIQSLFNITPESNILNNAYHLPLLMICQLQSCIPNQDNVHHFLVYMGYMTSEYCNLLEVKDPRALLLLGWWFKKLENSEVWWLQRRARIEGAGIRIWLERWSGGPDGLAKLYDWFAKKMQMEMGNFMEGRTDSVCGFGMTTSPSS